MKNDLRQANARIQALWDRLERGRAPGGVVCADWDGRLWYPDGTPCGSNPVGGFLILPSPSPKTLEEWEAMFGPLCRAPEASTYSAGKEGER